MSSQTAFRVNFETLSSHIHERVRIVGTVIDDSSDPVGIQTTDQQKISVYLSSDSTLSPDRFKSSKWIEVTGIVRDDKTIQEEFTVSLPGEVDNDAWNQMAVLIDKHRDIFI
ncbi:hypothetical protein M9Y10_022310 [Tritrichomonas musculus]|uniref:Replication factor A protein 3 n=1 Tax=Tritrichomonas musculus TaxID=1915356 RepID=A0ABR2KSW1_9EUKA